jgi:hypothetical protein
VKVEKTPVRYSPFFKNEPKPAAALKLPRSQIPDERKTSGSVKVKESATECMTAKITTHASS